jgi:hypothetical protein
MLNAQLRQNNIPKQLAGLDMTSNFRFWILRKICRHFAVRQRAPSRRELQSFARWILDWDVSVYAPPLVGGTNLKS